VVSAVYDSAPGDSLPDPEASFERVLLLLGKKRTKHENPEQTEDAKGTESTLFGFRGFRELNRVFLARSRIFCLPVRLDMGHKASFWQGLRGFGNRAALLAYLAPDSPTELLVIK